MSGLVKGITMRVNGTVEVRAASGVTPAALVALLSASDSLLAALRPFAEAVQYLHPSQSDECTTLDGFTAGDIRRAAEVIAKATEVQP